MTQNFPVGTQIVTVNDVPYKHGVIKRGSVGVVKGEGHFANDINARCIFVNLPDGREVGFAPRDIVPQRSSFREEHSEVDLIPEQIRPYIEFEFVVGSQAYSLATENSDEDVVGGFVLPTKELLGLKNYRDTVVKHEPDVTYHEIKKLIHLACKGNPNVIELGEVAKRPDLVKRAPTNELINTLFEKWNDLFLSKYVFRAYQGYALSQFKKIEQDLRNAGEIRWKHACHLLRLLWSGAECMKTGRVILCPKDHNYAIHDFLMSVKRGEITLEKMVECRNAWEKDFQYAFDNCKLPESADVEEAHKLLIAIREKQWKENQ